MHSANKIKREDLANETKEQPSLMFHSSIQWPKKIRFNQVCLLEDGIHFVATGFSLDVEELEIWNIQTQQCIIKHPIQPNFALTLLKDNKLAVAHIYSNISLYQIDLQNRQITEVASFKVDVSGTYAMTLLQDMLFIGSSTGLVSGWNLTTHEKIKAFQVGSKSIDALETRQDGSLVIANEDYLFIYDLKEKKEIHKFKAFSSLLKTIVLPDDTLVCCDVDGFLHYLDFEKTKFHHKQQISLEPITSLIQMPNGLIGCFIWWDECFSLNLFKPSWIQDYVNVEKSRKLLSDHLPSPIVHIVASYAGIALFNSPKMPNKKECFLTEEFPTLTRP